MFELTPFAGEVVFCVIVGLIGWLIFGDFRLRDFSWSEATKSVFTVTKRVLRAPSVILLTFDDQPPRTRWWVIFFVVQNPLPFLAFPLQLLYIPYFNSVLMYFWAMTWVLCIIFLTNNRKYLVLSESDEWLYDALGDCFGISWLVGTASLFLFDPFQFMVASGQTPFDAQPFSSSPGELLIAAFFLLPYLGFIGYLTQRQFFLKKVEQQGIDDQALALAAEGYSMAGTTFKPAYKKTLTKTIKIEAWENLFTKEWVLIQGEKRSLHQIDLKVTVQDWGIQFEKRYVFYVHNHGWDPGRHMKSFDLNEYRDYEKMLVETMNQYHPLELQRRYADEEEDIKARYVNSGRAKIYELLLSTI